MSEHVVDIAYRKGYDTGLSTAAVKIKEAFHALPGNTDTAVKDLLLDLYNEISSSCFPE